MKPVVIHNETCPICSREVAQYKRLAERDGIELTIEGLDGPTRQQVALTRDQAAREFHVFEDGQLHRGVDAFVVLWRHLPGFKWLATVLSWRPVNLIANLVYDHVLAPILFFFHKRRQSRAR